MARLAGPAIGPSVELRQRPDRPPGHRGPLTWLVPFAFPKHSSRSPRRTQLTILAAVAALLALCVVLVNPFGINKAYALNDSRDVTWNLDQGASGYSDMISAVAARMAGSVVYGSGDTTVDATESITNDYFGINLAALRP